MSVSYLVHRLRQLGNRLPRTVGAGMVAGTLILAGDARAEVVQYTIDPQQSSLTLSAFITTSNNSVFGFNELAPGSLVTSYGGTIVGDLAGSILTFSGGSAITALENPLPPFNPTTPAGVDNYGALTFANGGAVAENRLLNIVLDLPSGTATAGLPTTATFAYLGSSTAITPFLGTTPYALAGAQTNTAVASVQLLTVGNIETLTLPVLLNNIVNGTPSPGALFYTTLQGTLIASRVVPEPAALALLAVSGLYLARSRRRP